MYSNTNTNTDVTFQSPRSSTKTSSILTNSNSNRSSVNNSPRSHISETFTTKYLETPRIDSLFSFNRRSLSLSFYDDSDENLNNNNDNNNHSQNNSYYQNNGHKPYIVLEATYARVTGSQAYKLFTDTDDEIRNNDINVTVTLKSLLQRVQVSTERIYTKYEIFGMIHLN